MVQCLVFFFMRYHYEPKSVYLSLYGKTYSCDHPVYSTCTLYIVDDRGLAVIQQRFDSKTKSTIWTDIDPWLVDDIYLNERFMEYFTKYADRMSDSGLYPTVNVRQVMWFLRMKPLERHVWETVFDRTPI